MLFDRKLMVYEGDRQQYDLRSYLMRIPLHTLRSYEDCFGDYPQYCFTEGCSQAHIVRTFLLKNEAIKALSHKEVSSKKFNAQSGHGIVAILN